MTPPDDGPHISPRKKLYQLCLIIIGPIRLLSLYHWDVFTDIYNIIFNFYLYCHYNYGHASVSIMVTSYITTLTSIRFQMKESWKKAKDAATSALATEGFESNVKGLFRRSQALVEMGLLDEACDDLTRAEKV